MDKDKKYLLSQNSGGSKPSMNPLKFFLNKKERLPQRYAPKHLTKKDQKFLQNNNLQHYFFCLVTFYLYLRI